MILGISLLQDTASIANGSLDKNIEKLFDFLDRYNRPIYLRWGYEVEGPWNKHNPSELIQGWHRMYDILQKRPKSKKNIALVWQVAAHHLAPDDYESYYPGDEYIDWMGFSYFSPQDLDFQRVDKLLNFARERQKPVFVNESTPQRYDLAKLTYAENEANRGSGFSSKTAQEIWDEWFETYFRYIEKNQDIIRALTYINAPWEDQPRWCSGSDGYWGRSEVQSQPLILENWLKEIKSERYLHGVSNLKQILNFVE